MEAEKASGKISRSLIKNFFQPSFVVSRNAFLPWCGFRGFSLTDWQETVCGEEKRQDKCVWWQIEFAARVCISHEFVLNCYREELDEERKQD